MKNSLAAFDMDGTLYDTLKANYYSYKQALNEFGFDLEYQYFAEKCQGKHYKEFLPKILDKQGYNESLISKIHIKKQSLYFQNINHVVENKHLINILKCLSEKYYIALVTTASKKNCHDLLDYFNRKILFDLIITQEDVSKPKPNSEGYIKAMNFFGISKENTLIFEDSDEGVEAGRNAGARTLRVL
ncbi:haloacid dehalogenase [Paenibacillus sp. Soil766]|uniref:HAD family hydrolase n=1 Tax=Paenibacillus sp. Soil766 TaxID=1736404 RepID=UPI00070E6216|nr:HAD-IA family hydrolase [Paenibacillus sp. Soil766]KRE86362.1 haloacid dehalogenase [Paenibacillus sp. Soil766]